MECVRYASFSILLPLPLPLMLVLNYYVQCYCCCCSSQWSKQIGFVKKCDDQHCYENDIIVVVVVVVVDNDDDDELRFVGWSDCRDYDFESFFLSMCVVCVFCLVKIVLIESKNAQRFDFVII